MNSVHGLKMGKKKEMCYIFTPFGTEQECQMVYELRVTAFLLYKKQATTPDKSWMGKYREGVKE